MHPSLSALAHRPWPLPAGGWTWRQSWRDLLFAHWRVSAAALRALVPAGLEVQEFDGAAWIGVVPFRMSGVMRRPWPDLPGISAFPELNVRTYVVRDGKPGVWFLSLDATNPLAVWAARRFFFLPYFRASMRVTAESGAFQYSSRRPGAEFVGTYRPTSEVYRSSPGSLEHWLTERYCLYALAPDGALWRNDVHHVPWPLQSAEANLSTNTMCRVHGVRVSDELRPDFTHFSRRIDVVVWNAEQVGN